MLIVESLNLPLPKFANLNGRPSSPEQRITGVTERAKKLSARSTLADHGVELLCISGELINSAATSRLERLRVGREDRVP